MRLVKMNGVDLRQFQFDYDLSWSAMFLNADGTVYARYGSRSADDPMALNSVEGLKQTMAAVLDAHRAYPANAGRFAAKKGPDPGFGSPEEIPSSVVRRRALAITRSTCIHCHNVHEAYHEVETRNHGRPRYIFKYPFPENIGLVVEPANGKRVVDVLPGSFAAEAGVRKGDVLETLNGQAILSLADAQFVLHHLPRTAELEIELRRGDQLLTRRLHLDGDWRRNDFTWRASLTSFPGSSRLYVYLLGARERGRLGIDTERVALEVRGLFESHLRQSGLKDGDIIVGYDGHTKALSPPDFECYLRIHHFEPGSVLKLDVLRDGETRTVDLVLHESRS